MSVNSWIAIPKIESASATAIQSAKNAKEMIDALCEEAKKRQDPELLSKVSQVQGLYTGYARTGHPDLADDIIVNLGRIIGILLSESTFNPYSVFMEKNQTNLIRFLEEQRDFFKEKDYKITDIDVFIDLFERYLVLQDKKEQTIKIYRGKVKAIFRNNNFELPISMPVLIDCLNEILKNCNSAQKKDHNMSSAISNLLEFIQDLLKCQ